MSAMFMVTVSGAEHPERLRDLATLTHQHQGKWVNSRVINLDGYFATIFKVELPEDQAEPLQDKLIDFPDVNLQILPCLDTPEVARHTVALHVDAEDRAGLIQDITSCLAQHDVVVDKMECHRFQVADAASLVFSAAFELSVPASLDIGMIKSELEELDAGLKVK
ncbi:MULTISPECIES: glycine cleavage system protein R [Aliagarivorans]|uniref:glycine cleavage system protein R n=1 Tax=Aliagarivorans TaxID=882379 RepID=UPI0004188E39|nr:MULTISPECIES: ACT domain-containing protein [Aliagarivorans]